MQFNELAGQILGHYRILQSVDRSETTTVFLAEDTYLRREVVVKVFRPQPGETGQFFSRFSSEARILAQLNHPNILPVYDYGEQQDLAYLVLPYMREGSLRDLLQACKMLSPAEALPLVSQLLNALQYAHDRGLIHGNIKPSQILFKASGTLALSGFSSLKLPSVEPNGDTQSLGETIIRADHKTLETPDYTAPEQIRGQVSPLSDIYTVGVILYEMLTGTRPFVADAPMDVSAKHLYEQPRQLHEINPQVSPQLEAIVLRALEKDPAKRYQQPTEFLQALVQAIAPTESAKQGNALSSATFIPLPPPTLQPNSRTPGVEHSAASKGGETAQPTYATLPSSGLTDPQATIANDSSSVQPISVPSRTRHHRRSLIIGAALTLLALSLVVSGGVILLPGLLGTHTPTPVVIGGTALPQTSCPVASTARAAVMPSLPVENHPTIIYSGKAGSASTSGFALLKRYDITTGSTAEIVKIANTQIGPAQVSTDGQWILFVAQAGDTVKLQLVRIDGHELQTLYCNTTDYIASMQWSANQKLVIFTLAGQRANAAGSGVYLLNLASGMLQELVTPSGTDLSIASWLDNTRVYLTDAQSSLQPGTIYLLDTGLGPNQHLSDLKMILRGNCLDFNGSHDSTALYVAQFTCGATSSSGSIPQQGPSSISVQPATGGPTRTIFTNPTLAVTRIRAISNMTLLLLIANYSQNNTIDTSHNGLWKINIDGTGLARLTSDGSSFSTTDIFVSRHGSMYALGGFSFTPTYRNLLRYGSLNGGPSSTVVLDLTDALVIGWAT